MMFLARKQSTEEKQTIAVAEDWLLLSGLVIFFFFKSAIYYSKN